VINVGAQLLTINQQGSATFEGSIQGTGGIDLTGGGQLTLHGNVSTIESITISNGYLTFSYNGNLSNTPSITLGASGQLWVEQPNTTLSVGSISGAGKIKVWPNANALQITQSQEETFSGQFTSDGAYAGEVNMVLNAPLHLTGSSSSFYGNINVLSGNLNLSGAGNFNPNVPLSVGSSATLNIATSSAVSIGSLSGSGNINLSSGGLTINQTQANVFSGKILG
jgi:cytoskeletal protein CcmA (bactofilin family)